MSDLLLQGWTAALIEAARFDHLRGNAISWQPGEPLRLLFVGYNGARNTGSDVRVEEMLRQIRHVLGPDRVRASVLTQDFDLTRSYFGDAEQVKLPDIFPPFLAGEVPKHHGVVACEGSMFKSRFADALTTMMIGALGIAAARNRLSVGYGAEAGDMSRSRCGDSCKRYCDTSLVITRNEESEKTSPAPRRPDRTGDGHGVDIHVHAASGGRTQAHVARGRAGTGRTPVLAICPINPFWWPVRASLGKSDRASG